MKYVIKIIKSVIIVLLGIMTVAFSAEVSDSIIKSINICINVIIPSMFIFMVISSYILSSGLYRYIFLPLNFVLKKVIRLDEELISVFLLSLIGGYPVGIKLLNELIAQNKNYSAIADKIAAFCYCISPSFAVTMLGINLFGYTEAGIVIYVSNVISCLITAAIYSKIYNLRLAKSNLVTESGSGIIDAINSSAVTLMKICVIIVFFNYGVTIAECLFNQLNMTFPAILKAILEISNILKTDVGVSSLPFVAALASFGSVCVIFQCISLIKGKYSQMHFYISRFFNAVLSYFIAKFILIFWKIPVPVFTTLKQIYFEYSHNKAALVFLMLMFIILIQKSEKIFKKG